VTPLTASIRVSEPNRNTSAVNAGPTARPALIPVPYSAIAGERCSPLTSPGSAALTAGRNSAVPTPARSASATVAANDETTASALNAPARNRSAPTARVLRENRSANAPNGAANTIPGRKSASSTSAIAHPECRRW
jgi:hypothetical protein